MLKDTLPLLNSQRSLVHFSEHESLQATSHAIFQLKLVVPCFDYFPPAVDTLAKPDNDYHSAPHSEAIAHLVALQQDFIALQLHHLLYDLAICLVESKLVLSGILVQLLHLLSSNLLLVIQDLVDLLRFQFLSRLSAIALVLLNEVTLVSILAAVDMPRGSPSPVLFHLSKPAHVFILGYEDMQLPNDAAL